MISADIEVIDDFLSIDDFMPFASGAMQSQHFGPCNFTADKDERDGSLETFGRELSTTKPLHETMFQAMLFCRTPFNTVSINDFYLKNEPFWNMFTQKLNVKKWWIIRLNVTTGQSEPHVGAFHTDTGGNSYLLKHQTTSIYYMNSNNGGTKFKDGSFVQSRANRLITFPSHMEHAGVWATNAKLRFVLNMNYETNG